MQVRFNGRAPDEAMVLLETFGACLVERRAQIGRRPGLPEITVCFCFLVRFPRSKETIDSIIEGFQTPFYRRVVVKQAAGVVVKERRRRPYAYQRRRSVITATVSGWLPLEIPLRIRIPAAYFADGGQVFIRV